MLRSQAEGDEEQYLSIALQVAAAEEYLVFLGEKAKQIVIGLPLFANKTEAIK